MIVSSQEFDTLNYMEPRKLAALREALGELRDAILVDGAAAELVAAWSKAAVVVESIRPREEVPA